MKKLIASFLMGAILITGTVSTVGCGKGTEAAKKDKDAPAKDAKDKDAMKDKDAAKDKDKDKAP